MRDQNLFGVVVHHEGVWFVQYQKEVYEVTNTYPADHRCYLAIGRDENERVFFDLSPNGLATITRIGSIRPAMAKSLRDFCQRPRDAYRFSTKSGVPTIDRQTMLDARLIRVDDKLVSSR